MSDDTTFGAPVTPPPVGDDTVASATPAAMPGAAPADQNVPAAPAFGAPTDQGGAPAGTIAPEETMPKPDQAAWDAPAMPASGNDATAAPANTDGNVPTGL